MLLYAMCPEPFIQSQRHNIKYDFISPWVSWEVLPWFDVVYISLIMFIYDVFLSILYKSKRITSIHCTIYYVCSYPWNWHDFFSCTLSNCTINEQITYSLTQKNGTRNGTGLNRRVIRTVAVLTSGHKINPN